MASNWTSSVPHPRTGEPLSEPVLSRASRSLEQRTEYLRNRLNSSFLGQGAIHIDAPLSSSCLVGFAVYFNATTRRLEPALAAVETDGASGVLVPAKSCDVIGIVLYKSNATLGDILLLGRSSADLTNSVADPDVPGRYYLSSDTPGMLVLQRPPVSVPVLFNNGDGTVYVLPSMRDFLEDHIHYRFSLFCRTAGDHTPPAEGDPHEIDNADADLPGWLPADHASFSGLAPAGAKFGYNIAADTEVSKLWPPIPVESAVLFLNRADGAGGTLVDSGPDGCVVLDRNGIWWMSDCYGDVPWPVDYVSGESESTSTGECPRDEHFSLVLSYTVMVFATDKTVVTSLEPADSDGPIRIVDCNGDPATTGRLKIEFDLDFLVSPTAVDGSMVIKELDGVTFKRGRVVEGILAGANVTISSTNNAVRDGIGRVHQGLATINADVDAAGRELVPTIVRLGGALERSDADVSYVGFPAGKPSGIRMKFSVPSVGLPSDPQVRLKLTCLARTAGTFPDLDATYRRLPSAESPTDVPGSDSSLEVDTAGTVPANTYFDVISDPIDVAAGDVLMVSIERNTSDGYSGEVGIIRALAIVAASEE